MNALRCLAFSARPINKVIYEGFGKTSNIVRMGMVKRNMMGETYEGTGKTTGYILNKKGVDVICIDYLSSEGFKLTNGWSVLGPTIFFPHTLFSWKVDNLLNVNEDSLALFSILRPKLDCLFIGYGNKEEMTFTKLKELLNLCKKMDLNTELLPTEDAAATFNFCALDRRFIAAALIPPKKIVISHDLQLLPSQES